MTDISQFSPRIRRPSYLESRTPGILRGSSPVRLQNTTEGAPNHQLIHKANSSGKRIPVCSLESHSNRRRGRLRPRLVGWSPPRKPLLDIWRHEYPTASTYQERIFFQGNLDPRLHRNSYPSRIPMDEHRSTPEWEFRLEERVLEVPLKVDWTM